jgi:transposase
VTKTHVLVDGRGRALVIIVSPGQAGDSPVLPKLLAELRVNGQGPGRRRTRPEALRAGKAYSSRGHRRLLRSRGIVAVIPEPADQAGHRQRRGSNGGRPVSYDVEDYKGRNVRRGASSTESRTGEDSPAAMTSTPSPTAEASSSAAIIDWLTNS